MKTILFNKILLFSLNSSFFFNFCLFNKDFIINSLDIYENRNCLRNDYINSLFILHSTNIFSFRQRFYS